MPKYFDTTSKELSSIAPDIDILHTQIRVDSTFDFSLEEIIETADEIECCAASLMPTTYYGPEWVQRYTAFVTEAGLEVLLSESFVDQGLYPDHEAAFAASFDGFSPETMVNTIRDVARHCPEADTIVVPGLPCRFLGRVPALEVENLANS